MLQYIIFLLWVLGVLSPSAVPSSRVSLKSLRGFLVPGAHGPFGNVRTGGPDASELEQRG